MKLLPFFFLLCLLPGVAFAQALGHLELTEGAVKIRRAGADKLYKGAQKIEVLQGDEIQTGAGSKAFVVLSSNQDKIELYSSTFFKVASLHEQNTEVDMNIGKARFKITKPAVGQPQRRRFNVRTANAVIGVKGTEFVLGTGAETTSLLTIEGEVGMASIANPGVEVSVKANEASQVATGKAPSAPSKVSADLQKNIISSDSATGGFNQVQFAEPIASTSNGAKAKDSKSSGQSAKGDNAESSSEEENKGGDEQKTGAPAVAGANDEQNPNPGDPALVAGPVGPLDPGTENGTIGAGDFGSSDFGGASLDDGDLGGADFENFVETDISAEVDQIIDRVNDEVDQARTNIEKVTETNRSLSIKIEN